MEELYCLISGPYKGCTVVKTSDGQIGYVHPDTTDEQRKAVKSWSKKSKVARVRDETWI